MAIIVNLDVMMAKRKMSLNEHSEKVGLALSNLSILKTGKAKAIRFSTLETIFNALDCQPDDILEYVNDEQKNNARLKHLHASNKFLNFLNFFFILRIFIYNEKDE
jgi:putative transcriptional regulator